MKTFTFTEKELEARDKLYYEAGYFDRDAKLAIYNNAQTEEAKSQYLRDYYEYITNFAEKQAHLEQIDSVS